jgi:chromosome segregation protein
MRILYIMGVTAIVAVSSYLGISYYSQKQLAVQLNQVLDDTIKEKDQLQASVDRLQSELKEKQNQLDGLRDVQMIRQAMNNAQINVDSMTRELQKINQERISLQDVNVSLDTRLQNTTKEYMRSLAELKAAQDQVSRLNKEQSPDKKKGEELNKKISEKEKELARQKEELDSLKSNSASLLAKNSALEKKLKELESDRGSLRTKVEGLQGDLGARETPARQLQATIGSLRGELAKKEEQIADLEDKLARQVAAGSKSTVIVAKGDPKLQKTIDEMKTNNDNLKDQIAQLSDQ